MKTDTAHRQNIWNYIFGMTLSIFLSVSCAEKEEVTYTYDFQNPDLQTEERVKNLVDQMTLREKVSQMRYDAPSIERLGIPEYNWWKECLHGVARAGKATVFPQGIGMGATWNPNLINQMGVAVSDEARGKHHQFV